MIARFTTTFAMLAVAACSGQVSNPGAVDEEAGAQHQIEAVDSGADSTPAISGPSVELIWQPVLGSMSESEEILAREDALANPEKHCTSTSAWQLERFIDDKRSAPYRESSADFAERSSNHWVFNDLLARYEVTQVGSVFLIEGRVFGTGYHPDVPFRFCYLTS